MKRNYAEITPQIVEMTNKLKENNYIDPKLYIEHKVNRGLRDLDGNGVLTGLTEISEVNAKKVVDGKTVPSAGELYYRGYNIKTLFQALSLMIATVLKKLSICFFRGLPNKQELESFNKILADYRTLPNSFTRDVIMKAAQ